jgi:hypothetical protein
MEQFHTSQRFLQLAKQAARQAGYDPAKLELSGDGVHKLVYHSPEGVRRFGRRGYGDYLWYKTNEPAVAETKRSAYLKRARAIKDKGRFSPNQLAINVLWQG